MSNRSLLPGFNATATLLNMYNNETMLRPDYSFGLQSVLLPAACPCRPFCEPCEGGVQQCTSCFCDEYTKRCTGGGGGTPNCCGKPSGSPCP